MLCFYLIRAFAPILLQILRFLSVGAQKYFLLPSAGYPCYATDHAVSALITL